jgi:uroporphyrin-III C-methyltransferase
MKKNIFPIHPKLSVVGAGPGNPELITLKAINSLACADVVLYDALVNTDLLKYAPDSALKIFVGKRKNAHTFTQEQINRLIIDYAFTYGHVVRLKGGDPFVFGRGAEEIFYAQSFNIETEYVPGISSSISLAGLQHIPLTHRGLSDSFRVVTGTTGKGTLSKEIFAAANSDATVVVLMGLNKIKQISEIYARLGKRHVPVAVIENGSLPNEKIILGTIANIFEKTSAENLQGPAIIIIGQTVSLHPAFEKQFIKQVTKPKNLPDYPLILN